MSRPQSCPPPAPPSPQPAAASPPVSGRHHSPCLSPGPGPASPNDILSPAGALALAQAHYYSCHTLLELPLTPGAATPLHTTSTGSLYLQVPPPSRGDACPGLQADGGAGPCSRAGPHPRSAGAACCVSPAPAHGRCRDKLVLLMDIICPHSSAPLPSRLQPAGVPGRPAQPPCPGPRQAPHSPALPSPPQGAQRPPAADRASVRGARGEAGAGRRLAGSQSLVQSLSAPSGGPCCPPQLWEETPVPVLPALCLHAQDHPLPAALSALPSLTGRGQHCEGEAVPATPALLRD